MATLCSLALLAHWLQVPFASMLAPRCGSRVCKTCFQLPGGEACLPVQVLEVETDALGRSSFLIHYMVSCCSYSCASSS